MNKRKKIYTEYLNYNTASNILHAFDFSKFIGKPLNLLITINFYGDEDAALKFKNIRQLYANWIVAKRKKSGMTSYLNPWVFVFEKPHSNLHVHWAIHIEDELIVDLHKRIEKWVKRYTGSLRATQIDFTPVNIFEDKIVANYLAKGVNRTAAYRLHLLKYKKYQGFVKGQRARVSLCLGKTSRKNAAFKPKRDRNKWSTLHPHLMDGHVRPPDWDPRLAVAPFQPKSYLLHQRSVVGHKKSSHAACIEKSILKRDGSSLRRSRDPFQSRQGRPGATRRSNYAVPALPAVKHF